MERLTSNNTLTETESMNLSLTDLYTRLKAYEDIGLTPEELKKKLRTFRHYEDKFGDRPAKRWDELCNAEDQGRLIVLPCKVGDTVYALWPVPTSAKYVIYIAEVKETRIAARMNRVLISFILEPIAFRGRRHEFFESDFGKLVFYSREEAEKALEGMKCT